MSSTPVMLRSALALSAFVLLLAAALAHGGEMQTEKDIAYSGNGHELCRMDLYVPSAADRNGAAVLLIHGGAWRAGNREQWTALATSLAARGYVCASTSYRLAPEVIFPEQIKDVRLAMSVFKDMATKYGFDPERIGVVGSSAGGHLAGLISTIGPDDKLGSSDELGANTDTRPAAAVLYNPVLDFIEEATDIEDARNFLGGPLSKKNAGVYFQASPARRLDENFPPVLLIYGTDDTLTPVSNCVAFSDSLYTLGIPCEISLFPGQAHGFGYRLENPEQKRAAQATGDFFDRFLLK